MKIGYHASHEQFSPEELLKLVVLAEECGFEHFMSSDHFAPWSIRQGHSGHALTWLAAALQATHRAKFGILSIPGGTRMHPAVLAQAYATITRLFPQRLSWLAAGSGEAMNETITGEPWPEKDERKQRMETGIEIMRDLWQGKIQHNLQSLIPTQNARLWSLPNYIPNIYGAALSEESASAIGAWADGMITVRSDADTLKMMIKSFKQAGGKAKPLAIQLILSWANDRDQALQQAHDQWRHVAVADVDHEDLRTPEQFDAASAHVSPADMAVSMPMMTKPDELVEHIRFYVGLGFEEIYLHNAGRNQAEFIEMCGASVLPKLGRE